MAIINIVSLREGNQKEFDLYKKYVGTYVDKIYVLNDGADEKSLNHAEWIQAETVKEVLAEEDWVLVSDIYMRFSKTLLRELRELVKDPHVVAYSAAVNKCEKNFEEYIKGKGRTDIIFAANRIPFSVKLTDGISSIELEEEFRGRVLEISDGVYDFLLKEEEKAEGLTVQIPYEKTVLDNDKKRVLITNLFVQKYTGSELHVLSIAKQFVKRGYEVVVAVFSKAYPLLKYFEEIPEIHVVDCLEYKLPFTHYDIFFAQHYAVADWVILKNHITCDRLIVSKLGIYNSLETLPCFAEDADVLCCVSSESENQIIKELGEGHIIEKIENCVDDWFFEEFQGDKTAKLQSIAIISNHVQQEVLMAVEELRSRGIIVKLYGEQFESVLVTPKLLEPYDVVITIGKTVQYALACGTVPYVYDQFGGPGYLTENNFELARKYNFSGRGFQRKKANELASDIINNFEKAFIMRKNGIKRLWKYII